MVFALAFTMHTPHQACGETDCYQQKDKIRAECMETIKIIGPYKTPSKKCCKIVKKSDMACVCQVLTPKEALEEVSAIKLVELSRECVNPVPVGSICGRK